MHLETRVIKRIEGLVNQNLLKAIEKYSKQLVDELMEEEFGVYDALEYLEEYVFADILANIEIEENERLEEEKRKALKASNIIKIEELAKEAGIKVKYEL